MKRTLAERVAFLMLSAALAVGAWAVTGRAACSVTAPYQFPVQPGKMCIRDRCKAEHDRLNALPDTVNPGQMLFGINQGATFADLRVWHMDQIAKIDCDGYAIGGLAVGEPAEVMYEIIDAVEPHICLLYTSRCV